MNSTATPSDVGEFTPPASSWRSDTLPGTEASVSHLSPGSSTSRANSNDASEGAHRQGTPSRWDRARSVFKRTLDVVLSLVALLILWPFLGLMALAIRIDSKGPVFFRQWRVGKHGRLFKIYKFRTMHVNAKERLKRLSEEQRREFLRYGKIKDDPRITRVGHWLRKTSLDELPQLWNVLIGDMSLVGPRAYLISQLPQMAGREEAILEVLPGITGLWQVSGRSDVSFEERLALDRRYVREHSTRMDALIIKSTVRVIVRGSGAY